MPAAPPPGTRRALTCFPPPARPGGQPLWLGWGGCRPDWGFLALRQALSATPLHPPHTLCFMSFPPTVFLGPHKPPPVGLSPGWLTPQIFEYLGV